MDNSSDTPAADPNLLDDVEYILYHATGGKRFINYLVDWISFIILWDLYLARWYGRLLVALHFPLASRWEILLISLTGEIALFSLVVGGVEAVTGGKTLGKVLTKTRAINDDGSRISPKTAFLRCLSRFVPFEAFSALGTPSYPWHDRWTHSMVIDEKLTTLPPAE
jgi:uncharacterized RDD family membrane protein YckC